MKHKFNGKYAKKILVVLIIIDNKILIRSKVVDSLSRAYTQQMQRKMRGPKEVREHRQPFWADKLTKGGGKKLEGKTLIYGGSAF